MKTLAEKGRLGDMYKEACDEKAAIGKEKQKDKTQNK